MQCMSNGFNTISWRPSMITGYTIEYLKNSSVFMGIYIANSTSEATVKASG